MRQAEHHDGDVPFAIPMPAELGLASAPAFRSIKGHDKIFEQ
jgi:hypothetical protein